MFQVLQNTGAANTLLPSTLTKKLAEEPFRKKLIAYLNVSGTSLEERCAICLMDLPASEIHNWAECVRMPIEVRDFSEIFSELRILTNKYEHTAYQAVDVLAWFNRADVWRKPDRSQVLLNLADKVGFNVSILTAALHNAQALNTAEIIASVEAQDRSNGERIGSAFESARLAAITAALQS